MGSDELPLGRLTAYTGQISCATGMSASFLLRSCERIVDEGVLNMPSGAIDGGGVAAVVDEAAVRLAEPVAELAIGILPQDVVDRVAIEVADANDMPAQSGTVVEIGAVADEAAIGLAEPVGHLAADVVTPQNIGDAVAIEVAGADDRASRCSTVMLRLALLLTKLPLDVPSQSVSGRCWRCATGCR